MSNTSIRSSNYNERDPAISLQYIVLHYTGMKTAREALDRLCDPTSEVSAHYVIDEDGSVTNLVEDKYRAWHAGKSFWRGITDINSASLGIELVNPGHQFGYRPFPDPQIDALKKLLTALIKKYSLNPATTLLGHAEVAPDRKEDPGEFFPWRLLAEEGLGLWPSPQTNDYQHAEDGEVQNMLCSLGFSCPATDTYDRSMRAVLLAFQRRYEPENLTGTPERETIARLRSLLRMINPS